MHNHSKYKHLVWDLKFASLHPNHSWLIKVHTHSDSSTNRELLTKTALIYTSFSTNSAMS